HLRARRSAAAAALRRVRRSRALGRSAPRRAQRSAPERSRQARLRTRPRPAAKKERRRRRQSRPHPPHRRPRRRARDQRLILAPRFSAREKAPPSPARGGCQRGALRRDDGWGGSAGLSDFTAARPTRREASFATPSPPGREGTSGGLLDSQARYPGFFRPNRLNLNARAEFYPTRRDKPHNDGHVEPPAPSHPLPARPAPAPDRADAALGAGP